MKNRAKCKLCKSIIESFHVHDYVRCSCGEIGISGGNDKFLVYVTNYDNFLRVDDEGNEIVVTVKDKDDEEKLIELYALSEPSKPSYNDLLAMIGEMINSIEHLPNHAKSLPITHYDHLSLLLLLSELFKALEGRKDLS